MRIGMAGEAAIRASQPRSDDRKMPKDQGQLFCGNGYGGKSVKASPVGPVTSRLPGNKAA